MTTYWKVFVNARSKKNHSKKYNTCIAQVIPLKEVINHGKISCSSKKVKIGIMISLDGTIFSGLAQSPYYYATYHSNEIVSSYNFDKKTFRENWICDGQKGIYFYNNQKYALLCASLKNLFCSKTTKKKWKKKSKKVKINGTCMTCLQNKRQWCFECLTIKGECLCSHVSLSNFFGVCCNICLQCFHLHKEQCRQCYDISRC